VFLLHALFLGLDFSPVQVVEGQEYPAEALPRGWNCGDGVYTLYYRKEASDDGAQGQSKQEESKARESSSSTSEGEAAHVKQADLKLISVKGVHMGDTLFIHVVGTLRSGGQTPTISREIQLNQYFPKSDSFQTAVSAVSVSESESPRHRDSWKYLADLAKFNEAVDSLRTRIIYPLLHPNQTVLGSAEAGTESKGPSTTEQENKEDPKGDKENGDDSNASSQLSRDMTAAEADEIARAAQEERERNAQAQARVEIPPRAPPPYSERGETARSPNGMRPPRSGGDLDEDRGAYFDGDRPVFNMPGGVNIPHPGTDLDPLGLGRNGLGGVRHGEYDIFEGGNLVGPGQLDRMGRGSGAAGRGRGGRGMAPRFDPYGPFPGMGNPNRDHMRKPGPGGFGPGGWM